MAHRVDEITAGLIRLCREQQARLSQLDRRIGARRETTEDRAQRSALEYNVDILDDAIVALAKLEQQP